MLQEQDAPVVTKSSINTNTRSAQMSSTGLINVAATRDGKLGQDGQVNEVVASPLATTNTDTPSPTLFSSVCSLTSVPLSSDESLSFPQTGEYKARSQSQGSVEITKAERDSVEPEMQQLTWNQENMTMNENATMNVAPDIHSQIFPPALGVGLFAKAIAAPHPSSSVEKDTQGDLSSSAASVFPRTKPDDIATSSDSQYDEQMDVGQHAYGMITHDDTFTTNPISPILVASSTLLGAPDSESSQPSQAWEAKQRLHPTTEDHRAGMQEYMEVTSGGELDDNAVDQHGGHILVIPNDPLTTRKTNVETPSTAAPKFPLGPGPCGAQNGDWGCQDHRGDCD
ncbi:hypothetical protein BDP27DRAFT_1348906 [Rhodocollybia butyracea]|uniref:Uncharacterized protein n=1 Tax=Rhodocollybia butyracea TaxID=206335 RepID=A0A9P5P274_9AGAR|nr:hypothetical protein BDP27DRAFT_1348906 [Rhodocollybia butyracea]